MLRRQRSHINIASAPRPRAVARQVDVLWILTNMPRVGQIDMAQHVLNRLGEVVARIGSRSAEACICVESSTLQISEGCFDARILHHEKQLSGAPPAQTYCRLSGDVNANPFRNVAPQRDEFVLATTLGQATADTTNRLFALTCPSIIFAASPAHNAPIKPIATSDAHWPSPPGRSTPEAFSRSASTPPICPVWSPRCPITSRLEKPDWWCRDLAPSWRFSPARAHRLC